MIKPDLDKIITFDLKNSLRLEGDTCSYVQYSYARASRILEKTETQPNFDSKMELLSSQHETTLIKKIAMFDVAVNDSVKNLSFVYLLLQTHEDTLCWPQYKVTI